MLPNVTSTVKIADPTGRPLNPEPAAVALVFVAAGSGGPPLTVRVRRALKLALRSCGLRCVEARAVEVANPTTTR
jgi:ferredoxin-NADP reductase